MVRDSGDFRGRDLAKKEADEMMIPLPKMLLGVHGTEARLGGYAYYSESAVGGWGRFRDARSVMRRFSYLLDPLFLLASLAYAVNRWILKPLVPSPFLHNHFDDLLLIPAALPVMLWIQRVLNLRKNDDYPTWPEVIMHWAVWSVVCEWIGPFYFHMGVADVWDVVSYAIGGMVACLWWKRFKTFFARP
jgi:hypothetical protein